MQVCVCERERGCVGVWVCAVVVVMGERGGGFGGPVRLCAAALPTLSSLSLLASLSLFSLYPCLSCLSISLLLASLSFRLSRSF